MCDTRKTLQGVLIFLLMVAAVLSAAYALIYRLGFGTDCFVALAITVITLLLGYSAQSIVRFYGFWQDHSRGKTKTKSTVISDVGPFEPAKPLDKIPDSTYFAGFLRGRVKLQNGMVRFYDSGIYYEFTWLSTVMLTSITFIIAWVILYIVLIQDPDHNRRAVEFCLLAIFVFGQFFVSAQLNASLRDLQRTCIIKRRSVPFLGTVLRCDKIAEERTKFGKYNLIDLQYAFTSPNGRQLTGIVRLRKMAGYKPPPPGTPLVVLYVDDDWHMPL